MNNLIACITKLQFPDETPITLENLWQEDSKPWIQERIKLIKSIPNFWLDLKPIELGFKMLEICEKLGFTIHILTKGPIYYPAAWMRTRYGCFCDDQ